MGDTKEPRLLELCRRVIARADGGGEWFSDDAAVQAVLDDPVAASIPITPADDPDVACATWTAPQNGWPEREWLIKGWLPVGRLGMLSGRGGRGKSRLMLQLAARMASTPPKAGHVLADGAQIEGLLDANPKSANPYPLVLERRHCGPVVFASWEDERDEVGRRLAAMATDRLVDVDALQDRLLYLDLRGRGAVWAPGSQKHVSTVASLTKLGARLRVTAEHISARLLVIDSLAGAYASDENTRALVRAFCADWDAWASRVGCAVLLVAHPPKRPSGKPGATIDEDTDDDFAGSTDWHNAVRFRWSLGNADTGKRRRRRQRGGDRGSGQRVSALALACQKSSYGETPTQAIFLAPAPNGCVGWRAIDSSAAAQRAAGSRREWELITDGERPNPDAFQPA